VEARELRFRVVRSPIKKFLQHFDRDVPCDVLEAALTPILTPKPWIQSIACLEEAAAFNVCGVPTPRSLRIAYLKSLYLRPNCKKIVFWSHAGLNTLRTYGGISDGSLDSKVEVVYPAIRRLPDPPERSPNRPVTILFSGTFFIKGGVNVVDAFERLQKLYPEITLRICSDEKIDFLTNNVSLRERYLEKIRKNKGIIFGRVSREEMISKVLPESDIYLLPSYGDAFGFAILEAMAWAIPVIATNYFAIPEIVEHEKTGLLIDTSRFNCQRMFRGCVVESLPDDFREHVTESLFQYLCKLVESPDLRHEYGREGLRAARTTFSFESRNARMLEIYQQAVA